MNTEFRLSAGIFEHYKFLMLGIKLGEAAQLCLFQLFAYTATHHLDGQLSGMNGGDVERIAKFEGEPGKLFATLVRLRWLDIAPDGSISVHDWKEHNAWITARGGPLYPISAKDPEVKRVRYKAKTLRLRVAERDGYTCRLCGRAIDHADLHVDHIVPVCKGGTSVMSNLQSTHSLCNLRKGKK